MLSKKNQHLTTVQSLVFQLSWQQFQQADQTYFGLCASDKINELSNGDLVFQNEYLMKRFNVAILGHSKEQQEKPFEKIQVEKSSLWTKTQNINGKSIRLVFFPLRKYLMDIENGPQSYRHMVMQFWLFNKFLKPEMTKKKTLVSISYMARPVPGMGGRIPPLKLQPQILGTLSSLMSKFNLQLQQIKSKLVYVVDIDDKNQSITFDDKLRKQNKIYILTNDKATYPLYGLEEKGDSLRLKKTSTLLLEKNNHIDTAQCYIHFHYNQFFEYKSMYTKNVQDINVIEQLWAVILYMINPIVKVKQLIYKQYELQTEAKQVPKDNNMPNQYPHDKLWTTQFGLNVESKTFNNIFGFEKWNQENQQLKAVNQDDQYEQLINKNNPDNKSSNHTKSSIIQLQLQLGEYTNQFQDNVNFLNQQENFNHALILDQINRISKDITAKSDNIQKQTDLQKKILLQRSLLEFTKIIVRFLNSLKKHRLFADLLKDYQSQFYEHILSIYLQAYDQFCWANKIVFGKLFDLSQKINDLKSSKKQLLKVVKSVNNLPQINKKQGYTLQNLQDKKKILKILLNLLQQNKSNDKDKQVDLKILTAKYDLGSIYQTNAVMHNFGNTENKQLKDALKILFYDLYKHLFYDNKNFLQQYGSRVNFNELQLLEKISGILKVIGRIDLSIEIEKKLNNVTVVENYYNRWLMKHRSDMGAKDLQEMNKIIFNAIDYFKTKFEKEKVQHYYNLLIKNCKNMQDKKKYDQQKFDYITSCEDKDERKKFIQKARNTVFPLSQTVVNQIIKVYKPSSLIVQ